MTNHAAPYIVPGSFVTNPKQPDWGMGQVQSVVGTRVTVNFEHAGKKALNSMEVDLDPAWPDD